MTAGVYREPRGLDVTTAQLVGQARRGDRAAFAALIRRYERSVLAVALAGVGEPSAAGDVAQDALLRAWQRLDELNDPGRFGAWVCGIARNLAADARRRQKAGRDESIADPATTSDPSDELSRREEVDRVLVAIATLDPASREVVMLRYYQDLSSKRIAELTGTTPAAVDMRLSRARQALRAMLEPATAQAAARAATEVR